MKLTIQQYSTKEARAKMNAFGFGNNYGTIGFCNVTLKKDEEFITNDNPNGYYIEMLSAYHTVSTMQKMYDSNGKEW